jgi:2'-5' RNA ligase
MAEILRAFIAIEPPPPVIRTLTDWQKHLGAQLPFAGIRWTRMEQVHLTLKFLGGTPTCRFDELKEAVKAVASGSNPFRLQLSRLGCFPDSRHPRVLWAVLEGDLATLESVQTRVNAVSNDFSERLAERAFQPHLTLARVKTMTAAEARACATALASDLPSAADTNRSWIVEEMVLMESLLKANGVGYRRLAAFPLSLP